MTTTQPRRYLWLIIVVAAVGIALAATMAVITQQASTPLNPSTQLPSDTTVEGVQARLAKLVELPTGETPVLIDVKDPAKLSAVAFLSQARAGDKVLIYQTKQEGYIYRPSTGQLVAKGKVNLQ